MKEVFSDSPYYLNSVGNALRILDELSGHETMTTSEISRALGMGKASTFRLLYTLAVCGYVEKREDLRYSLSSKFIEYSSLLLSRKSLVTVACPFLDELRDRSGLSAHLVVLDQEDGWITFLYKAASRTGLQSASTIGSRMAAYRCATGKMLLSTLAEPKLTDLISRYAFEKFTAYTIASEADLRKELARVARNGWAEDLEESEIGLSCLAMPVRDAKGNICAAISISGATAVVCENRESELELLRETGGRISRELGYFGRA